MNGVVLISGNGSNLQSLINKSNSIDLNISCVISNVPSAFGLERSTRSGIDTHTLNHKDYTSRHTFDNNLSEIINKYNPDIIILAGFMRILTEEFTKKYFGKILNIHPSLLPKFQGLDTHQRVIEAKEKKHGVSVHFVTEHLDGGPIIAQRVIDVLPSDDAESLAKKVLIEEHKIYPEVVQWYTSGRLKLDNDIVLLDNKPI
jgi:phosphoribosylglycinamide formyltransferase-1